MYDKVSLWVDRAMLGCDSLSIAEYLDGGEERTDMQTGDRRLVYGHKDRLQVTIYPQGIYVTGSFPKLLHDGSNIYPCTRHEAKEAVEAIGDMLHIPAQEAIVTGLEIGYNCTMKHKVSRYVARLGDMPYLLRYQVTEASVIYKGKRKKSPKEFTAYDKIADAKAKGMKIPTGFEEANILRYEMKLTGKIASQIGVHEVKASSLYDRVFFNVVCQMWRNSYLSIRKNCLINTDMNGTMTPKDMKDVLLSRLLKEAPESYVADFVNEIRQRGAFARREDYTRFNKMIGDVSAISGRQEPDELIKELDDEIKNATAFL